ncbi:MAG: hypothetical protein H7210_10740, partial [Pyrinomonadaceae bacterium]|nr:hypothetical protein [Phycisphaerales bacterium]
MTDPSADVAQKTSPTEVRIAAAREKQGADKAPGLGRPKMLVAVTAALFLVLIGGALAVIRAFTAPAPSADQQGEGNARPAARGAGAIEAAIAAAQQYSNNNEYSKAEAILAQGVREYPTDQPLRLNLARTLVAEKKFAEAYPHYEAAIAMVTSSGASTAADGPGPAGAAPSGDPAANEKRPSVVGDPQLHFEAGTIASKAGLLDRAEEHYSMAQTGDMTDPRYPLYLGMVQLRLNKESAAQASLVRAVTLDPSQSVAWGTLAELSLQNNQLGLAMQHIEKARTFDPETPRWRIVQARTLKRRGDKGDVELAAQLLLAMDKSEQLRSESIS